MKRAIIYFLILLFAVWLGVTMYNNPGYVLISYHNWSLETSFWFALLAIVLLFLVFYWVMRFSSGVNSLAMLFRRWLGNYRKNKARKQTFFGLCDLLEGNFGSSEKKLFSVAKNSDMPLINYLAAAFVAQKMRGFTRRDEYLRLAQNAAKDRPLALGITRARLHMENNEWEEAMVTLQNLQQLRPRNVLILKLLQQSYLELKDWAGMKKILPLLYKRRVCSASEIGELEQKIYLEELLCGIKNNSIETQWYKLSRHLQKAPKLVAIYVEYLIANNKNEEAEKILKNILHKTLDSDLLGLYAKLQSAKPIKQLTRAEAWLEKNEQNAALLLCLGRLCLQQKLWGKAAYYLEKNVSILPNREAYFALGDLFAEQKDQCKALEHYRAAAMLSAHI